jgi:DNA invertase Pin-like site-specific DNA recombinase
MKREAVGYVGPGKPAIGREAVDAACARRGWRLLAIFSDPEANRPEAHRPGLARALSAVAERRAVLVVARLDDLVRSIAELGALLEWLDEAGGAACVLEPSLDTTTVGGRKAAAVVRALVEWERSRRGERIRAGHAAARKRGRPASRPAVADDPRLAARIARLRADGLSMRAIAERLNAEGVPTPRGGAMWRASSVQAALGYRRPPPPRPPHAPPVPPPPGPQPGRRPPGRGGPPPPPPRERPDA